MIVDNIKKLVLEDSTFEEARQNFNRVLQRLLKNMIDSGSLEGAINLKIDVSLVQEYIPNYDPEVEGESRKIQKPKFKHKVTSSITVKDELSGNKNPEMELVWDEQMQMYVLDYISETDHRTIFDKDAPWNQECQGPGREAVETDPEKRWMTVLQLPGEVADEGALPGEVQNLDDDADNQDDEYGYEEPEEPEE